MTRPTALIIGGAGGTGTLIATGLRDRGYVVTILHRGVHEPEEIAGFEHIHADPHFVEPMAAALGDRTFDVVIVTYGRLEMLASFLAGRCGRLIAIGGIPIYAGFLEAASQHPPGMQILARETGPLADTTRMTRPGAATFASKMISAERAVMERHATGGYSATIIRYPGVYGPNAISGSEEPILRRVRDGRDLILLPFGGLGIMSRCSTYNSAHAVLLAIECAAAEGRTLNCADEDQFTLAQWVRMILDEAGANARIVGLPEGFEWAAPHMAALAATTSPHALVDTRAAREILGYRDLIPAREALRRTVRWRLDHPDDRSGEAWGDARDYPTEDALADRLADFSIQCEQLRRVVTPIHPYPHPRTPSLSGDHRGR